MRLAHLSDTHLGYTGYGFQRTVNDPWRPGVQLRQQEADVLSGFARAVERIVSHVRPDLVVHSGDLFDRALPTPHVVDFALAQFRRLSDAGIPVVLVEGDHSCPRSFGQGHVVRLLQHLPHVTAVSGECREVAVGELLIHAYPHRAVAQGEGPDPEGLAAAVGEARRLDRSRAHLLLVHAVADGLPYFRSARMAASAAIRELAGLFDYVALGHAHRFSQVPGTDRAFYPGPTAIAAAGDFRPGYTFGFNVVELDGGPPQVRRELVATRPMHAYGLSDAEGLRPAEVLGFLECQAAAVPPDDAVCHVVVEGLEPLTRKELPLKEVEAIFSRAAVRHLILRVREQRWRAARSGIAAGDPPARFAELAAQADGDDCFRELVQALGVEFLTRAAAQVGAADLDETDESDGAEGTDGKVST